MEAVFDQSPANSDNEYDVPEQPYQPEIRFPTKTYIYVYIFYFSDSSDEDSDEIDDIQTESIFVQLK